MCTFFFLILFTSAVGYTLFRSASIFLFWRRIHAAGNWPQAAGRVVGSDIVSYRFRGQRVYYTEIIYSYTVLGTEYTGKFKVDTERTYEQDAEKDAAQYPSGMPITVHYNPKKPQDYITEFDRIKRSVVISLIAYLVMILLNIALLLYFGD